MYKLGIQSIREFNVDHGISKRKISEDVKSRLMIGKLKLTENMARGVIQEIRWENINFFKKTTLLSIMVGF